MLFEEEPRVVGAVVSGMGKAADPNLDVLLARDVNGLPMLPATGIAGALRNLADESRFGKAGKIDDTRASDLVFSDGLIHLSDNHPRDGMLFEDPQGDLWQLYQTPNPVQRDHVKINDHGVAADTAKFQRGAVPKGSRFSFEISMMSDTKDDPDFRGVLTQLYHPLFGLGGARRSGYGAMRVEGCKSRCFNLRDAEDWKAYCDFCELEFGDTDGLDCINPAPSPQMDVESIKLKLKSEGFVMVGSSQLPICEDSKEPDQTPYREVYIDWRNGIGAKAVGVVIPGSAIKGPLRHRTEFHYTRLNGKDGREATNTLFGTARHEDNANSGAGKVRIADALPPPDYNVKNNTRTLPHVSIDRFSGGANRGALFSNEALWKLQIEVMILLEDGISTDLRAALDLAIKDLQSGHLQIGAGGGDGLGVFLADDTGATT